MKSAVFLVALALAAPAAAQSPAPPQIDVAYTQFTLPNGLRVILHEDHSIPLVTVNT
jgi:predicted Zn-dependent peptidase